MMRRYKIARWMRSLNLKRHEAIFQDLTQQTDGFALSRLAREGCDAMEYTYGEIEFVSFIALLSLVHPEALGRFYDLGSGVGKAVLACAMVFDMQSYCGIELFSELHEAALTHHLQLQQHPDYRTRAQRIALIQGDFLKIDFSQATLVFINATALIGETWEVLNQRLAEIRHDVIVITISKKLNAKGFSVMRTTSVLMSWGVATAYIHQLLTATAA